MSEKPEYLSEEALQKLHEELAYLKKDKRREVADRIEKAKDLGDLSENAEYHDAKDELAFVEGRVMELEDKINRAVVIEVISDGIVGIGTTVIARSGDKERAYTITGSHEADPLNGRISNESPIGKAFIGRKEGDEVEFEAPAGKVRYTILSVK